MKKRRKAKLLAKKRGHRKAPAPVELKDEILAWDSKTDNVLRVGLDPEKEEVKMIPIGTDEVHEATGFWRAVWKVVNGL